MRHIAFNSPIERFQKFRRSGRGKSEADDLYTVYQHLFEQIRRDVPQRLALLRLRF
jgi:hypothetical protein